MTTGISLHLGLNFVDPDHYDGWNGELAACEFDANDMADLAKSRGFKPAILLREKATAKAVKSAIEAAAAKLAAGDIFFLSYSGHGGQVPDLNGDEGRFGDAKDRQDETWCLFDRELIDDELAALWTKFKKGVRIVVLSDSCHSGSSTRERVTVRPGRMRKMPREQAISVYEKHKALYDAIQFGLKGTEQEKIKATVLLISGCMDHQTSLDGDRNGLFTETLLAIWKKGTFAGGYGDFRNSIAAQMPEDQTPVFFPVGAKNPDFEKEQPFTVKLTKPAAKKAAKKTATKPVQVVLQALDETGYTDPRDGEGSRPDSDIETFFRRIDQDDDALGVPKPQRTAQFVLKIQGALGIPITAKELIDGVYLKPQDIADLV